MTYILERCKKSNSFLFVERLTTVQISYDIFLYRYRYNCVLSVSTYCIIVYCQHFFSTQMNLEKTVPFFLKMQMRIAKYTLNTMERKLLSIATTLNSVEKEMTFQTNIPSVRLLLITTTMTVQSIQTSKHPFLASLNTYVFTCIILSNIIFGIS